MPFSLQMLLLSGSIVIFFIIIYAVHKKRILIDDSLFWIALALIIIILGIFPQIVYFFSDLFGFKSSANLIFATITALLLLKEFRNTAKLSLLRDHVNQLAQEVALRGQNDHNVTKD